MTKSEHNRLKGREEGTRIDGRRGSEAWGGGGWQVVWSVTLKTRKWELASLAEEVWV